MKRLWQVREFSTVAILAVEIAFFTWWLWPEGGRTHPFLNWDNALLILKYSSIYAIAAIGAAIVIISGGIDLAPGAVMALSGVIGADLYVAHGWALWSSMLMGVGVGLATGVVSAVLIVAARLPPFIATLGMLLVARGAALTAAKGVTVDGVPDAFNALANARPLGIPMPLLITVAVVAFVAFLLHYTKFGRYVQAIGSNPEAARVSGVPVERTLLITYILGGALAGLAGLIEVARQGSGNPTSAEGYELDVVTAVVVGGASLSGGEGRVSGTILGALLVAVLRNGLNLLNVEPFTQKAYIGLLIIAAVAFDQWARRLR